MRPPDNEPLRFQGSQQFDHALRRYKAGSCKFGDSTGIDSAPAAIALAEGKSRERALAVRFLVWSVLHLSALSQQFDTVLDSGLFHVPADDDCRLFVDNLSAAIPTGGRYFMLSFSDRMWPARLSPPATRGRSWP
jgi:2-polyprenyl-3-methyl-5-hydroxy-6-metoxy-1,4-benzoquinol methylase